MESMTRRHRLVTVTALLASAVAGCTGHTAVTQDANGRLDHSVADEGTYYVAADDRVAVTGVSGSLLDGTSFDLAAWKGKVVVVNFWGTWCGPCQAEAQALEEVYRDNESRGVEFLGVDIRDDRSQAQSFLRDHDITYPSLYDESNLVALRFRGVPPKGTPTTVVLDAEGRVAARHTGSILYTQLRAMVDHVVREDA
jgi:thiol-disulfide isomerase/thioredoxin